MCIDGVLTARCRGQIPWSLRELCCCSVSARMWSAAAIFDFRMGRAGPPPKFAAAGIGGLDLPGGRPGGRRACPGLPAADIGRVGATWLFVAATTEFAAGRSGPSSSWK